VNAQTGAALVRFGVLALASCSAEAPAPTHYEYHASVVVSLYTEDQGCGLPGLPDAQYAASFSVRDPESKVVSVTEDVSGCSFNANSDGAVITASNVDCVYPKDSPAQQWGIVRRLYTKFLIDRDRKIWTATWENWRNLQSGPSHSCAVGEGRLVR
jgi:hypothetical protein